MLRSLQIRNFAIIDEIDITFNDDMTVLTGETGAGKSILIDALSLVLGERGSSNLIRNKEKSYLRILHWMNYKNFIPNLRKMFLWILNPKMLLIQELVKVVQVLHR